MNVNMNKYMYRVHKEMQVVHDVCYDMKFDY